MVNSQDQTPTIYKYLKHEVPLIQKHSGWKYFGILVTFFRKSKVWYMKIIKGIIFHCESVLRWVNYMCRFTIKRRFWGRLQLNVFDDFKFPVFKYDNILSLSLFQGPFESSEIKNETEVDSPSVSGNNSADPQECLHVQVWTTKITFKFCLK